MTKLALLLASASLLVPLAACGTDSGGELEEATGADVEKDDGSKQLAYKGKPLYLFVGDKKAGDRNGDKMKDVWHIVKD